LSNKTEDFKCSYNLRNCPLRRPLNTTRLLIKIVRVGKNYILHEAAETDRD